MARRNYSNTAVDTTITSSITAGATSLVVASATGWPAAPFVLVIEKDTANEELILVGAKTGTTFSSLTRGFGGTSAQAHNAGTPVVHVAVAEDFDKTWTHVHNAGDDTAIVSHDDLSGVSANDHHPQSHAHTGADGSGTVAHADTTGKTANDHHAQSHIHDGIDGSGTVAHSALTGIGADDHHPKLHAADHGPSGVDPLNLLDDYFVMDQVLNDTLNANSTGTFQTGPSLTFNRPAGWATYRILAWGGIYVASAGHPELRCNIGGSQGTIRFASVGPLVDDADVGASHYAAGLSAASQIISIVFRTRGGGSSYSVVTGWLAYMAIRES